MAICSIPQLVQSSIPFRRVAKSDLSAFKLTLLCNILKGLNAMAICDVPTLMSRAACFCKVTNDNEEKLFLQLLCEISAVAGSGGGGTTVCITGGIGAPVGMPPCNFSVYIQQPGPNFGLWLGDTVNGWGNVLLQGP